MNFSSAIQLNDINDYLAPSQTCIKPVKIAKTLGATKKIVIGEDGTYTATTENGQKYVLQKAQITLNDCLACSGCITTAETILISEHSADAFRSFLAKNRSEKRDARKIVILSLSAQSLSSLSAYILQNPESILASCFESWLTRCSVDLSNNLNGIKFFLVDLFQYLGVHVVNDILWSRDIALQESCVEFIERFRSHSSLPLFAGVCPGWVCFAEKSTSARLDKPGSQPFSIISHLSSVRSPQQVAGMLFRLLGQQNIYHVSVMPCFDKKLEACRQEFSSNIGSDEDGPLLPDVDLVLATNELPSLLESVCPEFNDHNDSSSEHGPPNLGLEQQKLLTKLCKLFYSNNSLVSQKNTESKTVPMGNVPQLYRYFGSGSGGYAEYVFMWAAETLFHIPINEDPSSDDHVLVRQLSNRDIQEYLLFQTKDDRDMAVAALASNSNRHIPYRHLKLQPTPLLSFAVANGFRNIQAIVQYLRKQYTSLASTESKSNRSIAPYQYPFDYVEVMACPGGCLNGGGQLKGTFARSTDLYFNLPICKPMSSELIKNLYNLIEPKQLRLRTTYRQVPQIEIVNPSALKW